MLCTAAVTRDNHEKSPGLATGALAQTKVCLFLTAVATQSGQFGSQDREF